MNWSHSGYRGSRVWSFVLSVHSLRHSTPHFPLNFKCDYESVNIWQTSKYKRHPSNHIKVSQMASDKKSLVQTRVAERKCTNRVVISLQTSMRFMPCAFKTTRGDGETPGSKRLRVRVVFGGRALAGRVPRTAGTLAVAGQRLQQGAWGGSSRAARGAERHHGCQNESQAVSHFPAGSASQSRGETCGERQPKSQRDRRAEVKERAEEEQKGWTIGRKPHSIRPTKTRGKRVTHVRALKDGRCLGKSNIQATWTFRKVQEDAPFSSSTWTLAPRESNSCTICFIPLRAARWRGLGKWKTIERQSRFIINLCYVQRKAHVCSAAFVATRAESESLPRMSNAHSSIPWNRAWREQRRPQAMNFTS